MFRSYPGLLRRLKAEEEEDPKDEDLILDIKAAIHVVEEDQGKTLRDLEKLTSQNQITFDILWALFILNTLVFNHHTWIQQDRLLLVRRVGYGERMSDRKRYLNVVCDVVHDDGHHFGLARQYIEIDEFRGVVPITELNVFPLDYRPDKDAIYERAMQLGRVFAQMKPHSYHEIQGQAMRDGEQRVEKFFVSSFNLYDCVGLINDGAGVGKSHDQPERVQAVRSRGLIQSRSPETHVERQPQGRFVRGLQPSPSRLFLRAKVMGYD